MADAGDTASQYVYDGEDIVLALDKSAALTNRYLHGPAVDQILADEQYGAENHDNPAEDEGIVYWPLVDNLGSVRQLVTSDGEEAQRINYDSFGQMTVATGAIDHIFGYTGREHDAESHLQFNRARYYDAALGRWLNPDPGGFAMGDENLYRYVGNGPTNATDPSGLMNWSLDDAIRRAQDDTRVTGINGTTDEQAQEAFKVAVAITLLSIRISELDVEIQGMYGLWSRIWGVDEEALKCAKKEQRELEVLRFKLQWQWAEAGMDKLQFRVRTNTIFGYDVDVQGFGQIVKAFYELGYNDGLDYDAVPDNVIGAGGLAKAAGVFAAKILGRALARKAAQEAAEAAIRKAAAEAAETAAKKAVGEGAEEAAKNAAKLAPKGGAVPKEGIYEFPDAAASGKPYVGQSGNIPKRLEQHKQAGRLGEGTVPKTTEVPGGKTAREVAEHQRIQDITGGAPARQSPNVANQRDPIGPNRGNLLDKK